eukprot:CAMPEP_0179020994 /NCGR_PEP_ID=MMETSP0796-20121207/5662_1 /TAXON_ID=73915 /ORGANISM="Pyrodinium bahamense, Strain pbaha01" /LENGTH=178 /DNA_ID=CAMNT_0020716813 /DNA_START=38 /DNA_END=571 /DNA_ORIENTATION=+
MEELVATPAWFLEVLHVVPAGPHEQRDEHPSVGRQAIERHASGKAREQLDAVHGPLVLLPDALAAHGVAAQPRVFQVLLFGIRRVDDAPTGQGPGLDPLHEEVQAAALVRRCRPLQDPGLLGRDLSRYLLRSWILCILRILRVGARQPGHKRPRDNQGRRPPRGAQRAVSRCASLPRR